MVRNFEINEIDYKSSKNGLMNVQVIQVKSKGARKLKFSDVKEFYNSLLAKGTKRSEIAVIVDTPDGIKTIKGFEQDLIDFDSDKYYNDRAANPNKFDSYDFANFRIKV